MSSLAAKTETQMDDVMIVSLERPLKFFFWLLGYFLQLSIATGRAFSRNRGKVA